MVLVVSVEVEEVPARGNYGGQGRSSSLGSLFVEEDVVLVSAR